MVLGHLLLVEVLDEVGLRLQLPVELLGHYHREVPLLGVCDLLTLHSLI